MKVDKTAPETYWRREDKSGGRFKSRGRANSTGLRCGGECPRVEDGEEVPGDAVDDEAEGLTLPSGDSFTDDALLRAGTPSGHVH
jgi:hypothetical protein